MGGMSLTAIATPIVLAILKVAAVALAGFWMARRGLLHASALADLSNLVIKVLVPCLIFSNAAAGFTGVSLASSLLVVLGAPVVLAIGYGAGSALARLVRVRSSHWRAVVSAATFGNSAYLPIAVATAVLPPLASAFPGGAATQAGTIAATSIIYISLFGVLYSPLFWGFGLAWLQEEAMESAGRRRVSLARFLPPPVVGVLLGYFVGLTPIHLFLTPSHAPLRFLFEAVSSIGGLTVTMANLILGGMLAQAVAGRSLNWRDGVGAASAKLVAVPAATLALLFLSRGWWADDAARALAAFVLFLQAVTPSATNLAVMSRTKGVPNESGVVIPGLLLVTYPLAALAMPLWLLAFFRVMTAR